MVNTAEKQDSGLYYLDAKHIKPLPLYDELSCLSVNASQYSNPQTKDGLSEALAALGNQRKAELAKKRNPATASRKGAKILALSTAINSGAEVLPINSENYFDPFSDRESRSDTQGFDLNSLSPDERADIEAMMTLERNFENSKHATGDGDYVDLSQQLAEELGEEVKPNMPDLSGILPTEMYTSAKDIDTKQLFAALILTANRTFGKSYEFSMTRFGSDRYKVTTGDGATSVHVRLMNNTSNKGGLKAIVDASYTPINENSQTPDENLMGTTQFLSELVYTMSKLDGFQAYEKIGAGEMMIAALSRLPGITGDADQQIYNIHMELDADRLELGFATPDSEGETDRREYLEPAYTFQLERSNKEGDHRVFGFYPGNGPIKECDLPFKDHCWCGPDGEVDSTDTKGWEHYLVLDGSRGLGKDSYEDIEFELAAPRPASEEPSGEWEFLDTHRDY